MKYHSKRTTVNGIKFASMLEAERYQQLRLLEQTDPPLITDLKLQPEFQISEGFVDAETGEKIRSRYYVADFKYTDCVEHKVIVEDTKGVETDTFRLKWDLVRSKFPEYTFRMLKRKDVI